MKEQSKKEGLNTVYTILGIAMVLGLVTTTSRWCYTDEYKVNIVEQRFNNKLDNITHDNCEGTRECAFSLNTCLFDAYHNSEESDIETKVICYETAIECLDRLEED